MLTTECCTRCGNRASWYYHEQWTCDRCYRAEEYAPGHVRTGGRAHFLGNCHDCDARYMAGMTLAQAENWYRQGVLDQQEYEAYCHGWATSAYRYGHVSPSWTAEPADPEVIRIVAVMREALAARRASVG
jgi:hypothetical protein